MNKIDRSERFITRRKLAARWGVSYMTIRRREEAGHLTPRRVVGREVRYGMAEVLAVEPWVDPPMPATLQFLRAAPYPRLRVPLPMVASEVCAGFPSPADDHLGGEFDLNELLVSNPPATFLVRAAGLSMKKDHIFDGDLLLVNRAIEPRDGHIVVACLDGEFTVKRLRREGERVWLQPSNDDFPCIQIGPEREFQVWGVVTSKVTQFKV